MNKNNRKSNESWKAYEPNKVTPDQRQAELRNFASTIPRKAELSNSRALPQIQKGNGSEKKSGKIPVVAQSTRHAQPKKTLVAPKKQPPAQRHKSGPLPQVHYQNPKVSQKRVITHIVDPNRPENNPQPRKTKMAGRSFAQQEQEPEKLVVKWQPHRRNPDGPPIQVELTDCIIEGLPADVAHESEPMSKLILVLLAELLTVKEQLEELRQGGGAPAPQIQHQAPSAQDFMSGEMARAMQEAAAKAVAAERANNES